MKELIMNEAKSIKPGNEEVYEQSAVALTTSEAYDIERICKAFIRLLDAPLVKEQETQPMKKGVKRRGKG
jgi:hypothetical protein